MANMKNKNKNKKSGSKLPILIALAVVLAVLVIVLVFLIKNNGGSVTTKSISLINNEYTVELGQNMSSVKMTELVKGSEELVNNAVLDTSAVDFNKTGTYTAKITSEDKILELSVIIKDTTKPEIVLKNDSVDTYAGTALQAGSVIESVNDASECTTGFVQNSDSEDPVGEKTDSVVFDTEGAYSVMVIAVDESGNFSTIPLTINVSANIDYLNSGADVQVDANSDFTKFSTEGIPYGYGKEVDENNRPGGCNWYDVKWGQYAVDFIQPMSNYVFLTFDEGYEYGNTPAILDTLKEKNAKAVFFLTYSFAKDNPDLVQRMLDEGHVLGNHTVNHPSDGLGSLSIEDQISEIKVLHDYIKETYNYEMYLFRFPTGKFTEQSLAIVQSLGYRSVFWSFAHFDWDVNNQPDVGESLKLMLDTLHGGEIFLLHGVSTTDTAVLGDLIDGIRERGYECGYYAKTN